MVEGRHRMKAKYATSCATCLRSIAPGEEIVSAGRGSSSGWVHADCKPGLFEVEAAGGTTTRAGVGRSATSRTSGGPAGAGSKAASGVSGAGRATAGKAAAKAPRRPEEPIPAGVTAVYTDGSCSGNPGAGGWAWVIADGRQASGGEDPTTNQRMEVKAALEAIRALADSPLVVVSDSTYVVNCFRDEWWKGWRARGWKNSQKQPVANRDLWEPLVDLVEQRGDVTFRWVKGHSSDPMNDLVDQLAVAATAAQLKLR